MPENWKRKGKQQIKGVQWGARNPDFERTKDIVKWHGREDQKGEREKKKTKKFAVGTRANWGESERKKRSGRKVQMEVPPVTTC